MAWVRSPFQRLSEALEIMAAELKVDTPFSHDESSRC